MSGDILLKRQLVELAHEATSRRSAEKKFTALVQMLPAIEGLLQSMTDAEVRIAVRIDGEEIQRADQVQPTPLVTPQGGENLIVNHEGTFKEAPDEAPAGQLPRAVLAGMHTLQSLVEAHRLYTLIGVVGYSAERGKWAGGFTGVHSAESLPYLAAGLRDTLLARMEASA